MRAWSQSDARGAGEWSRTTILRFFRPPLRPLKLPRHIPLLVRAATLFPVCLYTRTASIWRIFRVPQRLVGFYFLWKSQRFELVKVVLRITTCRVLNAPPKHSSTISQIPYLYTALKALPSVNYSGRPCRTNCINRRNDWRNLFYSWQIGKYLYSIKLMHRINFIQGSDSEVTTSLLRLS